MNTKFIGSAIALGVAITTIASPALAADPGAFRPLPGMGSDTTAEVMDKLDDFVKVGGTLVLGSYDPQPAGVGVATTPDTACAAVPRANGSSSGVKALSESVAGTAFAGCLKFARSSSQTANLPLYTNVKFVPMASDGLTYAYRKGGQHLKNYPLATVQSIYKCTTGQAAADPNKRYQPLVPQPGSGTEKDWKKLMGYASSTDAWESCVKAKVGDNFVQEHDGSVLTNGYQIMPYSTSQWVAQAWVANDVRGSAILGAMNGSTPLATNPGFAYNRTVGNFISEAAFNDPNSLEHKTFINDGSGKSALCTSVNSATGQSGAAVIASLGMAPIGC